MTIQIELFLSCKIDELLLIDELSFHIHAEIALLLMYMHVCIYNCATFLHDNLNKFASLSSQSIVILFI